MNKVIEHGKLYIARSKSVTRGLLMGGGVCYAWKKQSKLEVACAVVSPPIYVGYQLINFIDDQVDTFIKENKREFLDLIKSELKNKDKNELVEFVDDLEKLE